MQIILLSGGSGTRLWPLSNDARSKQFLKILPGIEEGMRESMVQRVVRQLREANINAEITIATSLIQKDAVISQLGESVNIVAEPSRRDTFPAICLACEYLRLIKRCSPDEVIVVMPCDPYTESGYFDTVLNMSNSIKDQKADLMVMGILPTYPSSKYGYIIPGQEAKGIWTVERFIEKPNIRIAETLINEGALWNGGVFSFHLDYITNICKKYVNTDSYDELIRNYSEIPKISFDYEVAEKVKNIGMIPFRGYWKDLGTWNTLTDELPTYLYGNIRTDNTTENTHIFNELNIPLICIGTKDLVIAASPDGILVSEKSKSENLKTIASQLKCRPMYEERRWGEYWVVDHTEADDGYKSLTKRLTLNPGNSISYQRHSHRTEIWTFIDGEGEIVLGTERRFIGRGETVCIPAGTLHALKAVSHLTFIEVQTGDLLIEEDIERFPYNW